MGRSCPEMSWPKPSRWRKRPWHWRSCPLFIDYCPSQNISSRCLQRKAPGRGCLKGEDLIKPGLIFKLTPHDFKAPNRAQMKTKQDRREGKFSKLFKLRAEPQLWIWNHSQGTKLKFLQLKYLARLLWADKYPVLSVPWGTMGKGDKNLGLLHKFHPNFSQIPREATGRILLPQNEQS